MGKRRDRRRLEVRRERIRRLVVLGDDDAARVVGGNCTCDCMDINGRTESRCCK